MYDKASDLYNNLLGIYCDEYYELSDAKRNEMKHKYDSKKLFLETYSYDVLSETKELSDATRKSDKEKSSDTTKTDKKSTDLPQVPTLEGNEEELKEGKRVKLQTNFKNEIRQRLYLLYQHNKITKKVYNNLIKSL